MNKYRKKLIQLTLLKSKLIKKVTNNPDLEYVSKRDINEIKYSWTNETCEKVYYTIRKSLIAYFISKWEAETLEYCIANNINLEEIREAIKKEEERKEYSFEPDYFLLSDGDCCPWCILFYNKDDDCPSCNYGKRNGVCFVDPAATNTYGRIIYQIEKRTSSNWISELMKFDDFKFML